MINITLVPVSTNWHSGSDRYQAGISFQSNGIGYMMDFWNARMISFNPENNEFKDLGVHVAFKGQSGLSGFAAKDTFYLMAGDLGFHRYDVASNKWIFISNMPTSIKNGVSFYLNNKIYFGCTYNTSSNTLNKEFWTYNPSSKSWNPKSNFPVVSPGRPYAYFTINNKGYALFSNKRLYKYDPDSDTWSGLSYIPNGSHYGCVSFVIDDKAYVGLGYFGGSYANIFYVFDPISESWSLSTMLPDSERGGRINSVVFVIDNKAYIGFGYDNDQWIEHIDFYEFDPNYPLK